MDLDNTPLETIVERAWEIGQSFDLTGIGYGRVHWGNKTDVLTHPFRYYYFLAGFVRLVDAKYVIEAGTHHGGSARALAAGFNDSDGMVETFDPNREGAAMLSGHPSIKAHSLPMNTEDAFNICANKKPDLVYIDAIHRFWETLLTFRIFAEGLSCRFCIMDDIWLNDEMKRVWGMIASRHDAINAAEVVPKIRPRGKSEPGFGLVRLRFPENPNA